MCCSPFLYVVCLMTSTACCHSLQQFCAKRESSAFATATRSSWPIFSSCSEASHHPLGMASSCASLCGLIAETTPPPPQGQSLLLQESKPKGSSGKFLHHFSHILDSATEFLWHLSLPQLRALIPKNSSTSKNKVHLLGGAMVSKDVNNVLACVQVCT